MNSAAAKKYDAEQSKRRAMISQLLEKVWNVALEGAAAAENNGDSFETGPDFDFFDDALRALSGHNAHLRDASK